MLYLYHYDLWWLNVLVQWFWMLLCLLEISLIHSNLVPRTCEWRFKNPRYPQLFKMQVLPAIPCQVPIAYVSWPEATNAKNKHGANSNKSWLLFGQLHITGLGEWHISRTWSFPWNKRGISFTIHYFLTSQWVLHQRSTCQAFKNFSCRIFGSWWPFQWVSCGLSKKSLNPLMFSWKIMEP